MDCASPARVDATTDLRENFTRADQSPVVCPSCASQTVALNADVVFARIASAGIVEIAFCAVVSSRLAASSRVIAKRTARTNFVELARLTQRDVRNTATVGFVAL